jgi:glycoprotease/Kae1 family metallohydrolase
MTMICLGIESTAHTFGIGIFDGKSVLSNMADAYKTKTGILPQEAAQHHRQVAPGVLKKALDGAGLTIKDVDTIAIAVGPGLPPCLLAGLEFARSLDKPLISVNHCIAHIEIGRHDTGLHKPLTVYVSGGNTQITAFAAGRYRVFGETLDIGIGNAIDKFGRSLGMASPCGAAIEKLALRGRRYLELPYTVKGMDLAFSGLVTAASKLRGSRVDKAYSFQETAFSMLVEVTERALAHTRRRELLLTGGVAQNKRLQQMLQSMVREHGAAFAVPRKEYCGDNGAMIAVAGYGKKPQQKPDIQPRWRTDDA